MLWHHLSQISINGGRFFSMPTREAQHAKVEKGNSYQALAAEQLEMPVLIGGRLNQIPDGSNTSQPTGRARWVTVATAKRTR